MELAAIGIAATALIAGITLISFWINFSDRITKAAALAEAVKISSDEAHKRAEDACNMASTNAAAIALFREQVARDYIHREDMREMKEDIKAAIGHVTTRLDRLIEARKES